MRTCSMRQGHGIGISKNVEFFIENLSERAPESPLNIINECQQALLKNHSRNSLSIWAVLRTV